MGLKLITAPTVEPVTLAEVKAHLRLDSGDYDDAITTSQSIAPGSQAIAAAYSLEGTAIDVLGYSVLALLEAGDCSAGTATVKLQHRDALTDAWEDVTGGAFTAVTAANDNAPQQLVYSGGKRYLRAVATVAGGACVFGVSVQTIAPYSAEDSLISALITAAREYCENIQHRALCTQTWELVLDDWPNEDYIELPMPPLQSVTSVKYKDTAGTETTWASTNYIVDPDSFVGRLALAYGITWPSGELYPAGGIRIRFVCGYGVASAVPQAVKQAMLLLIGHWYENREAVNIGNIVNDIPFAVNALLGFNRVVLV